MLNDISQSSWIIIASFLVAIFSVFLAIIFYFKNKRIKKLSYSIRSFNLISNSISTLPGFSATFKNNIINNLTVEKLILWNSGSDTIYSGDIATIDPIQIFFPQNINILDVRVSSALNLTNVLNAELHSDKKNVITITFEYIAAKEGCIISILHDGKINQNAEVFGTIKGGSSPKIYKTPIWYKPVFTLIFTIMMLGILFIAFYSYDHNFPQWLIFLPLLLFFPIMFFIVGLFEKFSQRKTGKMLDKKFDDAFSPTDFT